MQTLLWVALGSGIGGAARYWVTTTIERNLSSNFPWGTLMVNFLGSLLIGVFVALAITEGRLGEGAVGRQVIVIGIFGGFTTFSAFSLQTLTLLQSGNIATAAMNVFASVGLCILGVWVGHFVGTSL